MFSRNVGRRSIWNEMDRLQREMNRLMDGFNESTRSEFPPINVWANEEHAMITAELAGVSSDALDISVVGDTLTLSGERSQKDGDEQRTYSRRERWQGKFSRTIQLPFRIDAEEDKPHRISISAN